MGWMPGAIRRDVGAPARFSNGRMRSYLGLVLHVNDANSGDLYGWITGNNGMSCHWQVLKDGTVYQYIDTDYSSWCQAAGNDDYLSVETQGFPNEPLTEAQVRALARIMAFVHTERGIPLRLADAPGQRGLGWHGMGAPTWGHSSCPGDLRKAQRTLILTLAAGASGAPVLEEDDMTYTDWPAKDRKALADDVATALVRRSMGGVDYPGNFAQMLKATLDAARTAAAVNVPAAVKEALGELPAGAPVDADTLAEAIVTKLGTKLSDPAQ